MPWLTGKETYYKNQRQYKLTNDYRNDYRNIIIIQYKFVLEKINIFYIKPWIAANYTVYLF